MAMSTASTKADDRLTGRIARASARLRRLSLRSSLPWIAIALWLLAFLLAFAPLI